MGIPFYVASLLRTHKHIERKCGNAPLEVDAFGIDFNCFLHKYLRVENPIGSIVVALHELLTNTVRAKRVLIAFDGLVPLAKMVQQRYRRMKNPEAAGFDKHQLSPGTPFMKQLARTMRFMHPELEISDTLEPGEGEHKIFTWARSMKPEERQRFCIYGLDADLVLIAIAQRELGDISILRETENGFSTLSISALSKVLPMDPDLYVKQSLLYFGNDFMPNVAMFSLREDGYGRAIYYSNRTDAHKDERKVLMKRAKETERRIVAPDGHALEARMGVHLMDGVIDWEPVCLAFWKTYEWTCTYFTTSEVPDWEWFYPYPEAPLLDTLDAYDRPTEFTWDAPKPTWTVEDQLRFILPEVSLKSAGLAPIHPDELYEEGSDSRHPWMRRYAWECDPWVSLPVGTLTSATEIQWT